MMSNFTTANDVKIAYYNDNRSNSLRPKSNLLAHNVLYLGLMGPMILMTF